MPVGDSGRENSASMDFSRERLVEMMIDLNEAKRRIEDARYGKELTPEEASNLFPKRYGVEMEFEGNDDVDYDRIYDLLVDIGCDAVVQDGSLTTYSGFEVISKPFRSIKLAYLFMKHTLKRLREEMVLVSNVSPVAIHIHVSNISEPGGLYFIVEYFGDVFEHLRLRWGNDLVHYQLKRPKYIHVKERVDSARRVSYPMVYKKAMDQAIEEKIDPLKVKELYHVSSLFMDGRRRCTLRYAGFDSNKRTVEFRVFPHVYDINVYKVYMKIVEALIYFAENNSLLKVHRYSRDKDPLYIKLKKFQEVCNLKDEELRLIFNGSLADGAKFENLCRCPPPITEIEHLPLWFQPGDFTEIKVTNPVIYGRFLNVAGNRESGGMYPAILQLNFGDGREEELVVRLNDRDMLQALEHRREWFNILGEDGYGVRYIPRCMVVERRLNRNGGSMVVDLMEFGRYTEYLPVEVYCDVENMWNESIAWSAGEGLFSGSSSQISPHPQHLSL